MTDQELLQAYEPVLCFAHSERFFPMDVKHYLSCCQVLQSGPLGLDRAVARQPASLESFQGSRYSLRFVAQTPPWMLVIGWAVLAALSLAAGRFLAGPGGLRIGFYLAAALAVLIFLAASDVRLRLSSALVVAGLAAYLVYLPARLFLMQASIPVWQTACLAPAYLLIAAIVLLALTVFIFEKIIPEAPGLIFDLLSRATEPVAQASFQQYKQILDQDPQPVYYGRVENLTDQDGSRWKILQYHFFYAFNDWRLAANGMNHHEGDWEMVAVYLQDDAPHAVLYSQHGDGALEWWADVPTVNDEQGRPHPVIYAALGSHANYSRPSIIQAPDLPEVERFRRAVYYLDTLIRTAYRAIHGLLSRDKSRRRATTRLYQRVTPSQVLARRRITAAQSLEGQDEFVVSLPTDYATGDGIRIGCPGQASIEGKEDSNRYLTDERYRREVKHPSVLAWRIELLSPEARWVEYQGLWGVKSLLSGESGPPGPRWERSQGGEPPQERRRWGDPLGWLHHLEESKPGTLG